MPSKNKPKDRDAALARALDRIKALEELIEVLRDNITKLNFAVDGLRNRPDPWRPIGPRPNQPNPFREPPLPWVTPRPAPGQPNSDRIKITYCTPDQS